MRKVLMTIPPPGGYKDRPRWVLRAVLALLVALVAYAGFFAALATRNAFPLTKSASAPTAWRGAYHVHSTISHDGRATPEEIAQAAKAAGLQFVVLTDHNPKELFAPRFEEGVLLIAAQELSTPKGHVVALGASRALTEDERKGDVFGIIDALGGQAYLAHPEQQKNPWRDWPSAPRARGLELYSADSMFRDAQRRPFTQFLPAAASWLTNPVQGLLTVVGAQPEATQRLLGLSAAQPYVALCAHDAHGLPSYRSEFETLAMYLPPPQGASAQDPVAAARHVIDVIGSGQAWCAFHGIAAGDDFRILGARGEGGLSAQPGDSLTVQLPATVPPQVQVRVWGPAAIGEDGRTVKVTGTGSLQIEVWAKVPGMIFDDGWRPWLVPSPIRVVAPAEPAKSPVRAARTDGGA